MTSPATCRKALLLLTAPLKSCFVIRMDFLILDYVYDEAILPRRH